MRRRSDCSNRPLELIQGLEARTLLANTVVFDDVDSDRVTVKLTGPGTVTPTLSGGATGFIDFLGMLGTTGASSLSISVKQVGGDGRVQVLGLDSVQLKSLDASKVDFGINATATIAQITKFNVGDIPNGAGFNLFPPVGKAVAIACNLMSGNLTITGPVSTLKAFGVFASAAINSSSSIQSVSITANGVGDWRADNFGSISVGGELGGEWRARGPNSKGYSFGKVKAVSISNMLIDADEFNLFGRIGSITVAAILVDSEIIAQGLDTLKVGGFADFDLDLAETDPAKVALKSATIAGSVDGEWDIASRIGKLKFGQTLADFDIDAGVAAAHVDSIQFTGNQFNQGDFSLSSLKSLKSAGPVGGDWVMVGAVPGTNLALKTATPARLLNMDLRLNDSGLGSLTTQEINGCDLQAEFFGKVTLKAGGQGQGDLIASDLRATAFNGDGSTNQWSIASLSVQGQSDDSTIMTRANVKSLVFGRFFDTVVFVGSTDPLADAPLFGDTSLLDSTRRLREFRVTAPFVSGNFAVGGVPRVTAALIEKVLINGDTSRGDGSPGGFVAGQYGTVKLRSTIGALITFVPVNLGDNNPFDPVASDFVFRIVPL